MTEEMSLIKVSSGLLSALHAGGLNINVFAQEIKVLDCIVAGTSFRKLDEVKEQLLQKVRLEMKREANNEFDKYAIALWYENTKVGYIPRDRNEVIARLMDAGKQFYATIEAKEMEGNWLKLEVVVMMKD